MIPKDKNIAPSHYSSTPSSSKPIGKSIKIRFPSFSPKSSSSFLVTGNFPPKENLYLKMEEAFECAGIDSKSEALSSLLQSLQHSGSNQEVLFVTACITYCYLFKKEDTSIMIDSLVFQATQLYSSHKEKSTRVPDHNFATFVRDFHKSDQLVVMDEDGKKSIIAKPQRLSTKEAVHWESMLDTMVAQIEAAYQAQQKNVSPSNRVTAKRSSFQSVSERPIPLKKNPTKTENPMQSLEASHPRKRKRDLESSERKTTHNLQKASLHHAEEKKADAAKANAKQEKEKKIERQDKRKLS